MNRIILGALIVFSSVAWASESVQDIINSIELVPAQGDGYYTYTTDSTILEKVSISDVEAWMGRPLLDVEKRSLGDTYLILPEREVLVNVVYDDSCVESYVYVEALDKNFQNIPEVEPNEQFVDNDSCPD